MIFPPATSSVTPVIQEEASDAKNSAAAATSREGGIFLCVYTPVIYQPQRALRAAALAFDWSPCAPFHRNDRTAARWSRAELSIGAFEGT